jgi:hypothetical protein
MANDTLDRKIQHMRKLQDAYTKAMQAGEVRKVTSLKIKKLVCPCAVKGTTSN